MAGKSSKLAQGVNRTGNGLFRGMTAINSVRAEEKVETKKSDDIVKSEEISAEQKDAKSVVATISTKTVDNESAVEDVKNTSEAADHITVEESNAHEALSVTEKSAESRTDSAVEDQAVAEKALNIPVQEIKEEQIQEAVPQPVQEPVGDTIPEPYNAKPNRTEERDGSKGKASSRYEKEKFLLLDIRGYRDYVEHMAKAANMSATKYIRNLIQQDMDMNMDIYEAHKALEEKLKGRATR